MVFTFLYQDIAIIVEKGPLKCSVERKNVPYNFLMKARLLHALELSTGPIRVANTFG